MNIKAILSGCAAGAVLLSSAAVMAAESERTIHLVQDDAQTKFVTKVYELKHVTPNEIKPYLIGAVTRYDDNSTVQIVANQGSGIPRRIMVTTGVNVVDMVDQIISVLDRPGRKDAAGSIIDGTGVTRVAYTPKYRAAGELAPILYDFAGTAITKAYVNAPTNTVFFMDEPSGAAFDLEWLKYLDRPLPQVMIRFNCYEFRESNLRDIGFDYLAWKNGPGVNLLNVGYNGGRMALEELFTSITAAGMVGADLATSWGYGGFFTAPQFDMSFIRCLQQSGTANISSDATLTVTNTPVTSNAAYAALRENPVVHSIKLNPQYQNIARSNEGRAFVGYTSPYNINLIVQNPIINLAEKSSTVADESMPPARGKAAGKTGTVIFDYVMEQQGIVERGNTGGELSANSMVSGSMTLGFNTEKVVAVYEEENEIEQTIGLPFLSKIPVLGYLFSTKTDNTEHVYRVVTAEAIPMDADQIAAPEVSSASALFDTTGKFGSAAAK